MTIIGSRRDAALWLPAGAARSCGVIDPARSRYWQRRSGWHFKPAQCRAIAASSTPATRSYIVKPLHRLPQSP
jgi:hypothetical protein